MSTKVSLNRLEHFIPSPSIDGLLYVDENEEQMTFKSLGELNAKFGRDNITAGFNVEYDNILNKFIVSPGQTTIYKRIGYTYDNNGLHIHFPMWGLNGVYQFEEQDITTVEKDDSTTEYMIPEMTSNTTPYGKCSAINTQAAIIGNVYDVFNNGNGEISSSTSPQVIGKSITYMLEADGATTIKPSRIYIKNGSLGLGNVGLVHIMATKTKHPFDNQDWIMIKDLTNLLPNGAYESNTYTFNSNIADNWTGIRVMIECEDFNLSRIQLYGTSKSEFGSKVKNKYFLCHILRNNKEKNIFVASYNDIPVFDNDILIDYIPINSSQYYIDDFENQVYYETNENSQYIPDLTREGKTEVTISPDGIHTRKLFEYTVDNGQVISYYPKNDLATSYVNRFIIAEQQGDMGYKIYSDGWKIQWGNQNNPIFPVAFEKTPLIISPSTATNVTNVGMTCNGNWIVKGY